MVFQFMLSIILITGMTSCSKKSSSKNSSRATGWNVDSKKGLSNKKQEAIYGEDAIGH